MNRLRLASPFGALLAAGLALGGTGPGAAADDATPHIAVADAAFTPSVGPDRQPSQRLSRVTPGAAPYFWTLLSANAATLDQLKANGKLPIRHAWRRYVGSVALEKADPRRLEGDIPLDLGTAALADKLQYEIDHSPRHEFTWRTWSQKGALTAGSWSVFLKYADGTPVICQVVNGADVPCVYRLEVRAP
ncbi:MAG TPA: hypothetical protein VHA35_24725 [Dongiaceae bacterium]|nr:hypothetical protein [Dongiaceae bacterium]